MGASREHRLDNELNRLLDDLSHPDGEKVPGVPGKRTRVQELAEQVVMQHRSRPTPTPGRRTLVERLVAMASPLQLDDVRVLALSDVLAAMDDRRELRDATVAAADRDIARRAIPPERWRMPQANVDAAGHAMWQTAERRAATLYRRARDAGEVTADDPRVEAALARAGSGAPLPAAVKRKMEDELGAPLDRVRVHADPVAASAARALHAEAFTVGEDIFFADGAYDPESRAGQTLLAHELTHVVQGWQGRSDGGGARRVSQPGDALEQEADAIADKVTAGSDRTAGEDNLGEATSTTPDRGRGAATPTAPRPSARGVQRKASAQSPPSPAEPPATSRPVLRATVRRDPSATAAPSAHAAFSTHLQSAGAKMKAAFAPVKAAVAQARSVKIGAKAEAKGKHEKQRVDHHIRAQHGHAAQHRAAAAGHKKARHDEPAAAPPSPKLDPHSPIQFKKIADWSKYMPPPMPDQDERERKRILALVKNKVIGEQAEAQKILGALHADQVAAAAAIRKMKPGLQAQIATAQQAALAQVAASETSEASAVAGAYRTAQGLVNSAAAAARSKVNAAYSAAVAAINSAYRTNGRKLTTGKDTATDAISGLETAQLTTIAIEYLNARIAVASNASREADHARALGDAVVLEYDGDKLDAARDAAHQVADGWASEVPGRMISDAEEQIFIHQSESVTGATEYATLQRTQAGEVYTAQKEALDTAHTQALEGASNARGQALQQIDSIAGSANASLAAESAAQVASVHDEASTARIGITRDGQAAIAGAIAACDRAAKGLDGGAAGLVAGAKQVEAPDPEFTAQKIAEGEKLLASATTSITESLKRKASESGRALTARAGESASGMAKLAASAKQAADNAGQSAAQSITRIASGGAESLHTMQETSVAQSDSIASTGDTAFNAIVEDTGTNFGNATTDLHTRLSDAVEGLKNSYQSSIGRDEVAQILEEAEKAADAVKPWWRKAVAFVAQVVVVIVITVAVTAVTAGLGTGPTALVLTVAIGAGGGAVGSVTSQVVGNVIMGEPAFDIDWKQVGIDTLAAGFSAGITKGLALRGPAAIRAAMQPGSRGVSNFMINLSVDAGADIAGEAGANFIVEGRFKLDMQNLVITLATSVLPTDALPTRIRNPFRGRTGSSSPRAAIAGDSALGGRANIGSPGGGARPDLGGPGGGSQLDVGGPGGGARPDVGSDGKATAPETGSGNKLPDADRGGPARLPKPDDGGKPARPNDGGPAAKPDDGGKPARPDDGGSARKPEDGGEPARPDNDPSTSTPGDSGKVPGEDKAGKPPVAAEGDTPPGQDEAGRPPGSGDGDKPSSGEDPSPEQRSHDAERDAVMNEHGYVEGTRTKADETAARIEQGAKPKKDGLRDTEANARGREGLDRLDDPRVTPEQRTAIDREVAAQLRGKSDPTGKLDADIGAATDKVVGADPNGPALGPKPGGADRPIFVGNREVGDLAHVAGAAILDPTVRVTHVRGNRNGTDAVTTPDQTPLRFVDGERVTSVDVTSNRQMQDIRNTHRNPVDATAMVTEALRTGKIDELRKLDLQLTDAQQAEVATLRDRVLQDADGRPLIAYWNRSSEYQPGRNSTQADLDRVHHGASAAGAQVIVFGPNYVLRPDGTRVPLEIPGARPGESGQPRQPGALDATNHWQPTRPGGAGLPDMAMQIELFRQLEARGLIGQVGIMSGGMDVPFLFAGTRTIEVDRPDPSHPDRPDRMGPWDEATRNPDGTPGDFEVRRTNPDGSFPDITREIERWRDHPPTGLHR